MKDIIIGEIQGHSWPQVEAYAISVHRSGFSGSKIMFVDRETPECRDNLSHLGWILLPYRSAAGSIHFCIDRFKRAADALKGRAYRYVLWTDIRDVVYQSNPITWLEKNKGSEKILVGNEEILIKDEETNNKWIRYAFGEAEFATLQNFCVCNAGTIAGDAPEMQSLFTKIYELCYTMRPDRPNGDHRFSAINDQAMLDYLVTRPPFKDMVRIPHLADGLWAVCSALASPTRFAGKHLDIRPTLRDGLLVNVNGEAFSIIHQYDRNPEWNAAITKKWKATPQELGRAR